jgi:hypothetical protein
MSLMLSAACVKQDPIPDQAVIAFAQKYAAAGNEANANALVSMIEPGKDFVSVAWGFITRSSEDMKKSINDSIQTSSAYPVLLGVASVRSLAPDC